ncbi:MAG: hypothetical protein NZU63_04785 [Gemmataceae bacterium]|nr:hypothetical protein [Gemmataceae bacterium]MDW8241899.1 hypothetical protein [Thermogemmata sp.]
MPQRGSTGWGLRLLLLVAVSLGLGVSGVEAEEDDETERVRGYLRRVQGWPGQSYDQSSGCWSERNAGMLEETAWAAPPAGVGQCRYYFILFGGQAIPFRPRTAHTWAIFAKAVRQADASLAVEWFTISWLPAEGPVRPLRLWPQAGRNYTLAETMQRAAEQNDRVSMWGPFEISALRYELAKQWFFRLNSGQVRYRVLDTLWFNPRIAHCVHAVTYADPVLYRRIQPVVRVGEPGTSRLARIYVQTGAFIHPEVTHDWLIPVIGLDRYPFVRRQPGEYIPREFR